MLNKLCPGCHRLVPVLPPRKLANRSQMVLPWRRQQHSSNEHGLSSPLGVRCRYPVALSVAEYPPNP